MTAHTIAVTGIASYWGEQIAERLKTAGLRVLGIGSRAPDLPDTADHFIHSKLDAPELAAILRENNVSAVCHLPKNEPVATTAAFFATCAEAGVAHITLKSSTRVYGATAENPAIIAEEHPLPHTTDADVQRLRHMESLAKDLQKKNPALKVTILRLAHVVGPTADSALVRWLSQPVPVSLLGFNPLIQILHESDAVDALAYAVTAAAGGTFNIAASPPLPLARMIALAGKVPIPIPYPMALGRYRVEKTNRHRRQTMPIHPSFLRYRLVADTASMEDSLGFSPEFSAEETLHAFREHDYFRHLSPAEAARVKRIKQLQKRFFATE